MMRPIALPGKRTGRTSRPTWVARTARARVCT